MTSSATNSSPGNGLRNLVGARSDPLRLLRGAELAEREAVSSLDVRPGELRGSVSGSRKETYKVKITTPITGVLPGAGSQIRWNCTCPDWGDPCKHAVAVMLVTAQRFDDDRNLAATFIGSETPGDTETSSLRSTDRRADAKPTKHQTGLSTVAPLWAEGLTDAPPATTAQQFFGSLPMSGSSGSSAGSSSSGQLVGPDRLRQLGPLIVDSYDLAPDIIRMYTWLREN
jgi:uncharacterized Zn finger protein